MSSSYRSRDIEQFIKKKKSGGSSQINTGSSVAKGINEADESINLNAAPMKSNLKKINTLMMEMNNPDQLSRRMRKVSWSDAHGKDIAHVQEFEPSEEGELGSGVGNSCRCSIQ